MNAIEIDKNSFVNGHDLCDIMQTHRLLTKATKNYYIRFTPALVMTKEEVDEVAEIVSESFYQLEKLNEERSGLQQTFEMPERGSGLK